MSIHHLEQAAELELHATTKLVFMALCDDASKETRVAHPGMNKMLTWSGAKERRVHQILDELIERGLVARIAFAYPGRRAEFFVFPTAAEYEELDAKDPRLNVDHPVDNSSSGPEIMGATRCGALENGCNAGPNGCNPDCTPPVSTPLTDIDQVTEATTDAPVDNSEATVSAASDRQPSGAASPKNLAAFRGHGLSTPDVFASVGEILAPTCLDDEGLTRLAGEIIAVCPTRVVNPTAYVVKQLRDDRSRFEWVARAWVIAAEVHLERVGRAS